MKSNDSSLTIAYTPDSDDAFMYYALEHGCVTLRGHSLTFIRDHIDALNQQSLAGRYHVTATSSTFYGHLADRYWILSVGTSTGRGYGPVLAARKAIPLKALNGCRVGVAGIGTTGHCLMKMFCPGAQAEEMHFDAIADAVVQGEVDAGVMIHEELLYYPQKGLHLVADLGACWTDETGLPLPLGLNLVRKDLGSRKAEAICGAIRASLQYALDHPEEALAYASRFGRGVEGQCSQKHVSMFANEDTLWMPKDVRKALDLLLQTVREMGLTDRVPAISIVE